MRAMVGLKKKVVLEVFSKSRESEQMTDHQLICFKKSFKKVLKKVFKKKFLS